MRSRVEAVAAACDVSVDTVRYYQSKGLLPPPGREGRVAWYGTEHVERIREIRALQRKGLTLAAIKRVVEGGLGRVDAD
ncbi:MAG: MerR family transcriptional regulator, partial [Actinomycetota bacterium]